MPPSIHQEEEQENVEFQQAPKSRQSNTEQSPPLNSTLPQRSRKAPNFLTSPPRPSDDKTAHLDEHLNHQEHFDRWLPSPIRAQAYSTPFQDNYDNEHEYLLPVDDERDEEWASQIVLPKTLVKSFLPSLLPSRDALWALLYFICLGVMIFLWLALLVTRIPQHVSQIPEPGMVSAILDSLPVLISVFCVSCVLGAFWILLMGVFVKLILWSTVIFVPVAATAITSWSLYLLFTPASINQAAFLIVLMIITILTGTAFSVLVYLRKEKLELTIAIVQLATHVLRNNSSLFVMSLIILAAHLSFVACWIAMTIRFVTLASIKDLIVVGGDELSWIQGIKWTPTLLFFTGMLVWTTCIINNIHRMAVAGVVHHWYFSRHISKLTGAERTRRALKRAATVLIGTSCCGALLDAVIICTRSIIYMHFKLRDHLPKLPRFVEQVVWPLISYILRLAQFANRYTLAYASITSHGYITSARNAADLVARSYTSLFLREVFTRATFYLGTAILSALVGLGVVVALRSDSSVETVAPSSVAGVLSVSMWITWAVMRYWSSLMMNVIDASYLCFAIDVDNEQCHFEEAHAAFKQFRDH